jgi:4-hydroxy-4-methyl-2-oxoglutarate aldolase
MIDEGPLLEIGARHDRPAAALIEALRGTPTSFLADALGGRGALDWRVKPLPGTPPAFAGVALPCATGPADNLALCAAVALCGSGDVLVAATDGHTGASVAGDLLLGIARNRGAAAFVTDGLVRDAAEIAALGLPCFAMGVSPNSPARNGPGTVAMPVVCGGIAIEDGDIVVGDQDGVVIVPRGRATDIVARLADIRAAEAHMLAAVKAGQTEVTFVAPILKGPRVRHHKRSGGIA